MITVEEAQETILSRIPLLGRERVHILGALGRVLAEDITAERPMEAPSLFAGVVLESYVTDTAAEPTSWPIRATSMSCACSAASAGV